jgi:hypothetical protein
MKPEMFQMFEEHLQALEMITPKQGGTIKIFDGPDKGLAVIHGDRTALVRLSITILRYAIDARIPEGRLKAPAKALDGLFPSSSYSRDLLMQLDEAPMERG